MDWIATAFGWVGTLILGHFPRLWQPWGWICFIISTGIWIYVGLDLSVLGLVVCNAGYLLLEATGFLKAARKSKWL